jgi:hypothetical protein
MVHAHDAAAFAQYNLDIGSIFPALQSGGTSELRWLYLIEIDNAALRFRDDFLCYNEYIALLKGQLLGLHGFINDKSQVGAWGYLTYARDGYDA